MLRNIISQLQSDPVSFIATLCMTIPAVLLALTLHEMAHGYVALKCGDDTAYMLGRLSFNPLHHLDPVGTLCMLFLGFGWAKPVPVNPRKFRNYRRDDFLVSIAGITVNLLLFLAASLLMVGVNQMMFNFSASGLSGLKSSDFLSMNSGLFYAIYSGQIGIFTAFPDVVRYEWMFYLQRFLMIFSLVNLGLAIFNLLPIPPLDGYHVVNDILLKGRLQLTPQMHMVCTIGIMVLCFSTDIISNLMSTVQVFVQSNVMHFFLMIFGLS